MAGAIERSWKVVYGTAEGPEGRALELLSAGVGAAYQRDPGVYTLHVVPCERAGMDAVAQSLTNRILVGTLKSNARLRERFAAADVPKGGYLVRTLDGGRTLAIAGDTPESVIWGVSDFLEDGMSAMALRAWDGLRYRSRIFERPVLPQYESRRAPKTPLRGVFTWGHVIDDYRAYFRNLARLKFNEVVVWNKHPPVNAAEVVAYAHSWGIKIVWGYAWGWTTNCHDVDWARLSSLEDAIVREWETVWKPLPGDGIYFQSFTEINEDVIDGHSVAESVVALVNRVTARIHAKSPGERLIFGLHARAGVRNKLDVLSKTDPSVEIYWEDCGGFPFNFDLDADPTGTDRLLAHIGAEKRPSAVLLKGMLNQDWQRFVYPAGPFVLGCAPRTVRDEDDRMADALWDPFTADWRTRGELAYGIVRRLQTAPRSTGLVATGNFNGRVRYPLALLAELFWSADEPYGRIVDRVNRRSF